MTHRLKSKLEAIFNEHIPVNELLNKGEDVPNVSLELHSFSSFWVVTGRKTVLEFMTDKLREAFFLVSEPKLIHFFRKDGNITGDLHCLKVHVRLHDGQPIR